MELDQAVGECQGWRRVAVQDDAELVRLLTERNRDIVENDRAYDPFKPVGDGT